MQLLFKRSHASRQAALATVMPNIGRRWVARVGGPVRGRLVEAPTKAGAVALVHAHYTARLMATLKRIYK